MAFVEEPWVAFAPIVNRRRGSAYVLVECGVQKRLLQRVPNSAEETQEIVLGPQLQVLESG